MSDEENSSQIYIIIFVFVILVLGGVAIFLAYITSTQNTAPTNTDAQQQPTTPEDPFVEPEEVVVSNITSNSVVISWYTPEEATGYVKYGNTADAKNVEVKDVGDSASEVKRNIHYVKIGGLSADREYFFDIYSNDTVYSDAPVKSFSTFPQSENLSVPTSVIVEAPSTFEEGLIYSHAKNIEGLSSTISIRASSNKVLIEGGNMKVPTTGEPFDISDAFVYISVTDSSGKRTNDVVRVDDERKKLTTLTASGEIYVSGEDFNLPPGETFASGEAPDPIDDPEPEPEPTTPVVTVDPDPEPTQPTVTQIPKTAIEADELIEYASIGGGAALLLLGFVLKKRTRMG